MKRVLFKATLCHRDMFPLGKTGGLIEARVACDQK